MTTDDLFSAASNAEKTKRSNVPEMSVSELAFSLKRTLEDTFGRVRVRGELTGLKLASSGHLYGDIKDADANINIVCWKGTMARLSIRPEDGLDVIVTGKMTSYPKNSRYQLSIESMELAGEGALLKMLEDRRKKLAAEGLFDPARKKPLPFLPEVIGVVTSPTGAVIRDIIHRISERFPRRVLVWPVAVQGDGAASQIAAAIHGFNAIDGKGGIPRPDLLIVARGGGSLEDLMAFNEESVVRAAAESRIPLISAVGHETDTTLIDYAADLRAPTPTGAAERAVPVRLNLLAQIQEDAFRLTGAAERVIRERGAKLETLRAKLGDPSRILDMREQHLDTLTAKLRHGFEKTLSAKTNRLAPLVPPHPRALLSDKTHKLQNTAAAMLHGFERGLSQRAAKLAPLVPPSP
ncbi:MAG: exodeoxyribonuclease VII large subunit, partial [Micavibrio aeruginosavorus]